MKGFLKEKLHILLTFVAFYLIVEITTFIWLDFSFLPKDFFVDLVIAFALGSVIFLIKSTKLSIVYLSLIFGLIITLFLINATMYSVYYDLFSLQQLQLIGEAAGVFNFEHLSIESCLIGFGISALYVLYIIRLAKKYGSKSFDSKNYYLKGILSFLFTLTIISSFFMLNTTTISGFLADSNVTAYKRASFEKYGILGYYTKEIEDIIGQSKVEVPDDYEDLSSPTDYFGLLKGKNVINILMESVQPFAINEVLTPNIYKLTQEGLYFENSYSENKTNVSELISIIGNYPTISFNPAANDYDFSYSFPKLLKDDGYVTSYFHDNVPSFYSRGGLMPQLGFNHTYFHDDLYPGQEIWRWNGDYTLDSVTMEKMLPNFSSTDNPFYTFWASLSTHGPYDYGPENKLKFEELGYFSAIDKAEADGLWTNILAGTNEEDELRIRHYQAAVMELDKAIGLMIDDLKSKGILDDTIIVMYGDHNVYYHDINLKIFAATGNEYYNMEMYKNFFCIYNPLLTQTYLSKTGAENTTIKEFVSPYVIVPTLLDLFGYQYNTDLFLGSSIFDNKEDVFYSQKLTGFFNSHMYSADGDKIIYYNDFYSVEELNDFLNKCFDMKNKINYINEWYVGSKVSKDTEE